MEKLIKAIALHERNLMQKTIKGFLIYRIKLNKIIITEQMIRDKVNYNLKKFYLKTICRKYRRL